VYRSIQRAQARAGLRPAAHPHRCSPRIDGALFVLRFSVPPVKPFLRHLRSKQAVLARIHPIKEARSSAPLWYT